MWIVQGPLALIFLFAGGIRLVLPLEKLTGPGLTPLAAAGLVIIMTGATVITLAGADIVPALIPLGVGLLSAFVAYGRWRLAPHRGTSHPSVRQAAR